MQPWILVALSLCGLVSSQCTTENCKLPDCRCADHQAIPGNLAADNTPQIVLITFENALNSDLADDYIKLFQSTNPNGCPTLGSFFIQDLYTDYDIVSQFHQAGHEIGVNSVNGTLPTDSIGWINNIQTMIKKINEKSGIEPKYVSGVRAPQLSISGTDEFIGIADNQLAYDASCALSNVNEAAYGLWPYTYDYIPDAYMNCDIGTNPDAPFKGKWQFMLSDLVFENQTCATPSACTEVQSKKDAFDMFFNTFEKHYNGHRAPFMIAVNADFVKVNYKLEGIVQFIEYIRAAFDDTWVITVNQALQWIKDPTGLDVIEDFDPWKC